MEMPVSGLSFISPCKALPFHLFTLPDIFKDCGTNESISLTEENAVDY